MSERAATAADAALHALAALVPAGVLLLDRDGNLRAANQHAAALLDADDEAALRARWPAVRAALGLGDDPAAAGTTPAGAGSLGIDVTSLDDGDGGRVVVLRAHAAHDVDRRVLVEASRFGVQQHVLGGLLHDLNGPLNNIALTVALMAAVVGRQAAATPDDAVAARIARHVATLETQALRLAASSQAMSSVLHADDVQPQTFALHDIVDEVRRQLRHHAALHDIVLEDVGDDGGAAVHAAREPLRFALLALALAACALCAAGGRVSLRSYARDGDAVVAIAARPAALPVAARSALETMVVSPLSQWLHLAAGRIVVTAQGGDVGVAVHDSDEVEFVIALPAAR